jgi:predicted DNA-binding transcriptional regulator YafY
LFISRRQNCICQSILKAIGGSSVIEINYTSLEKNESTKRKVEPVGVYYLGSHWYLIAFCQMRKDYRNFRTDKITRLTNTGRNKLKDTSAIAKLYQQDVCRQRSNKSYNRC